MIEIAQIENKPNSKAVRRMIGLSLDAWNNWMIFFLAIGTIAAALVGVSTYAIVKLSRDEAEGQKKAFDLYKAGVALEVGKANESAEIAKANAAKANAEAAEANAKAEDERLARVRLEAVIAPRSLSLDQQKNMVHALKKFSGQTVSVISYSLDVDAGMLAKQIIACLHAAGITPEDRTASVMPIGGFAIGISISGTNKKLVDTLVASLRNAGQLAAPSSFPVQGGGGMMMNNSQHSSPTASILIGAKPLPIIH